MSTSFHSSKSDEGTRHREERDAPHHRSASYGVALVRQGKEGCRTCPADPEDERQHWPFTAVSREWSSYSGSGGPCPPCLVVARSRVEAEWHAGRAR